MNKIIREHYPVSQLPEDLRPSGNLHARVKVMVEEEAPSTEPRRPLATLVGSSRNVHGDEGTVLSHIGSLREDR